MLNCIIATMRPKSGMKRPSTPVSFMRRSTISVMLRDSENFEKQPVGFRVGAQIGVDARAGLRVTARKASGCSGRP